MVVKKKLRCMAKNCRKTEGVEIYGSFCGIKLAYCPTHNYLFRELSFLNEIAKGTHDRLKRINERKRLSKKATKQQEWQNIKVI